MLSFSRAVDWPNAQVGKFVIWLIFAATAISALNAIVRKVSDTSSTAAYPRLSGGLFAWSFPVAAGHTLLHREHVRIDVVNSHLPKTVRVWIDIVGYTLFLTPMCVMALYLSVPQEGSRSSYPRKCRATRGPDPWLAGMAGTSADSRSCCCRAGRNRSCIAFLRGPGPDPTEKTSREDRRRTARRGLAPAQRRQRQRAGASAQAH
ncbi:MAG: TRAP transporter small permease subunit [Burkholderiaceae bacterium]